MQTNLLKQWNEFVENNNTAPKNMYIKKDLGDFFNNKGIKAFINALIEEENLHTQNSVYVKSVPSETYRQGLSITPMEGV